jgi:hypothetical protein
LVLRGLDEGHRAILEQIVILASQGRLDEAIGSLASVLVAEDRDGQIVAASLTLPPGAITSRALQANLDQMRVLILASDGPGACL